MPQSYGYAERYNSQYHMVRSVVPEGHYHCGLAAGTPAHHTRESLSYAIELLAPGDPENALRAAGIVTQVLSLQERDPTAKTYGIWPMYLEEPLEVLAVPDWNYADFIGSQLFYIYAAHNDDLPHELAQGVRAALGHAAWSSMPADGCRTC